MRVPEVVLADRGYWNEQIEQVVADGSQVVVNPDRRPPDPRGRLRDKRVRGLYARMQPVITSGHGATLYRRRQQMIEPIFAHTKVTRRADRFQRRELKACRSKWRLVAARWGLRRFVGHAPATG